MANKDVKLNANIDGLNDLIKSLKKNDYKVRIGIIGSKASAEHEGSHITNAKLGSVHEFGGDIKIPAHKISVYRSINSKGEFKYDGRFRKKNLKSTNWQEDYDVEAYSINIPARSFLRQPLEEKLGEEITKLKKKIFEGVFVKNKPREIFKEIGSKALAIVHDAFDSNGFNQWKELAPSTKSYKARKHLSPQTLVGRGQLKNSISFKVIKND